ELDGDVIIVAVRIVILYSII
ncbi:unnamed protein product, partial [Allacma fusca]